MCLLFRGCCAVQQEFDAGFEPRGAPGGNCSFPVFWGAMHEYDPRLPRPRSVAFVRQTTSLDLCYPQPPAWAVAATPGEEAAAAAAAARAAEMAREMPWWRETYLEAVPGAPPAEATTSSDAAALFLEPRKQRFARSQGIAAGIAAGTLTMDLGGGSPPQRYTPAGALLQAVRGDLDAAYGRGSMGACRPPTPGDPDPRTLFVVNGAVPVPYFGPPMASMDFPYPANAGPYYNSMARAAAGS